MPDTDSQSRPDRLPTPALDAMPAMARFYLRQQIRVSSRLYPLALRWADDKRPRPKDEDLPSLGDALRTMAASWAWKVGEMRGQENPSAAWPQELADHAEDHAPPRGQALALTQAVKRMLAPVRESYSNRILVRPTSEQAAEALALEALEMAAEADAAEAADMHEQVREMASEDAADGDREGAEQAAGAAAE